MNVIHINAYDINDGTIRAVDLHNFFKNEVTIFFTSQFDYGMLTDLKKLILVNSKIIHLSETSREIFEIFWDLTKIAQKYFYIYASR